MYLIPSPSKKRRRSYKSYLSKTSNYFGKISVHIKDFFAAPDCSSLDAQSTDTDAQLSPGAGQQTDSSENFSDGAFNQPRRTPSSGSQVSLHIQRRHSANDALVRPSLPQPLPQASLMRSQSSFNSAVADPEVTFIARRCTTNRHPEAAAGAAATASSPPSTAVGLQSGVCVEPLHGSVRPTGRTFPLDSSLSGYVQPTNLQVCCASSCSNNFLHSRSVAWDKLVSLQRKAITQYQSLSMRLHRIEAVLWFQTAALVFAFGSLDISNWMLLLPGLAAGLWVLRSKPLDVEDVAADLSLLPTLLQMETSEPVYSSLAEGDTSREQQVQQGYGARQYSKSKTRQVSAPQAQLTLHESISQSPDFPLLVRFAPQLRYQTCLDGTNPWRVGINRPAAVEFETTLFKGKLMFWVANVKSSPKDLFQGRQRKSQCVVQGQFKVPLQFADVMTGQSFERPLSNMPSSWLVDAALGVARHIAPSLYVGPSSKPAVLAPLVASAQAIRVSLVGKEPQIDGPEYNPEEDMSLLDPCLKGLTAAQRKKHFDSPGRRAKYTFTTTHIWTMHFWQHLLDMGSLQLELGPFLQFRLNKSLNGQPLQIMAHSQARDQYLWALQVWHESQVEQAVKHGDV